MDNKAVCQFNYTQELQHFIKGYLYIITAYYLVEVFFLYPYPGSPFYMIMWILLGIQIVSVLIVQFIPMSYLKPLIAIYIHVITLALFYITVELGSVNAIAPCAWFFVDMLAIFILFPWNKTRYWIVYLFILIVLARILSQILSSNGIRMVDYFFHAGTMPIARTEVASVSESVAILFAFFLFCYFLYYLHKLQEIKIQSFSADVAEKESNETSFTRDEKLKELYVQIEKYFDSAQPFVNPDFTILQLASALNTNTTYVSRAIKQERDINFSVFISHYRIEKVKEMLNNQSDKYTLEYVAAACGFRHQSTFNKTFKQIEGITPSGYCSKRRQVASSQVEKTNL